MQSARRFPGATAAGRGAPVWRTSGIAPSNPVQRPHCERAQHSAQAACTLRVGDGRRLLQTLSLLFITRKIELSPHWDDGSVGDDGVALQDVTSHEYFQMTQDSQE